MAKSSATSTIYCKVIFSNFRRTRTVPYRKVVQICETTFHELILRRVEWIVNSKSVIFVTFFCYKIEFYYVRSWVLLKKKLEILLKFHNILTKIYSFKALKFINKVVIFD